MQTLTQWFFKKKWFPLTLRLAALLFFIFILYISYFGALKLINPNSRIALFVIWTLWWPILYISLLFFARAWCGFLCPISLFNEWGNKFRKGKPINILRWSFIAYVLFFVIVLIEQISGLFLSLNITLIFILAFFTSAFIFGVLFARWGFCKFVCPIGTILSVFSRLSFIGLRTQQEKCRVCTTRECMKGGVAGQCPMFNNIPSISSNMNCLLCLNCVKNCPYDSADVKLVKPGKEVIDGIGLTKAESLYIIALIGLTFTLNSRGTEFFRRFLLGIELKGALLRTADFILAIGLTLLAFVLLSHIITKFYSIDKGEGLKRYGYIYLPLVLGIMFFTITFGFLGPYVKVSDFIIAISKYVVLLLGVLWSIYFAYRLMDKKVFGTVVHSSAIIVIGLFWTLYLIPGPLNLVPEIEKVIIAEPGKIIKMDSYSMGFTPNTIIAKKGQEIVLDINNKDIMHAFDINEFNVHRALLGGTKNIIKFTPDKAGEFTYYCNVPGHTEAGMKGKLIVEE